MTNFELRLEGRTVAKIEIDAELFRGLLGGLIAPAAEANAAYKSAAIDAEQAADLVVRVDKPMRHFLSRLVEEGGALTWGETKQAFGVQSWPEFAEGPLRKLDKALHRATGMKDLILVWRVESEWVGLEKGEDEPCRLHVDGPALAALKVVLAPA